MVIEARLIGYAIGGAMTLASIVGVHVMYSGHYKKVGRLACEAAVEAANKKAEPIPKKLGDEKDKADDDYAAKTDTIRTETITGITALDLAKAQREAQNTGEELGRAKAIAEYRAKGGCMSDPLPADDGLLIVGQDQQLSIYGRVIGSDESPETEKVRQDAKP